MAEPAIGQPDQDGLSKDRRLAWTERLLPWVIGMVVGATLLFVVASAIQLYSLRDMIRDVPALDAAKLLIPATEGVGHEELQKFRGLLAMEAHAIQQRYHQANVL